jgi:hypothetical protein
LTKQISEHLKQVESLTRSLTSPGLGSDQDAQARAEVGEPQLAERIGSLFGMIDGVNAAPTPPQREHFGEIQTEFRQKIGAVNAFIEQTVPKLNDTLKRQNAPVVVPGKPVDMPR